MYKKEKQRIYSTISVHLEELERKRQCRFMGDFFFLEQKNK